MCAYALHAIVRSRNQLTAKNMALSYRPAHNNYVLEKEAETLQINNGDSVASTHEITYFVLKQVDDFLASHEKRASAEI